MVKGSIRLYKFVKLMDSTILQQKDQMKLILLKHDIYWATRDLSYDIILNFLVYLEDIHQ